MKESDKVIELADLEVGYLEKASNSQLDDKTANAGSANYTKYARDMDILGVYNGPKQGYAWCNVFIDWLFYKALGIDRATELLIGWNAGCTQDWRWFVSAKRIVSDPQRGDLVFFGNCDHIGIIENVDNNYIYTIEGNTSNKAELIVNGGTVARKVYSKSSKYIKGYARPNYNEYNGQNGGNEQPVNYPVLRKGSSGQYVRILQNALLAKGYKLPKYGADGSFGKETEEAVRQLQKDAGAVVDGVVGKETWGIINSIFTRPERSAIYPGYLIKKGQQSEDVRKVQNRLIELGYSCGHCGADSMFGRDTYNAVIAFQRDNGLSKDGIVGPATWNKLF